MMATGVNSVLNIGKGALFASQTALQTVGNNIANVNTTGYSRQAVRFEAWPSLDYNPGQMGQGVRATEVMRYFDKFIERNYLQKNSEYMRWDTMASDLRSVESIFNESSGLGIGSIMSQFFSSWEKLSQFPDDAAGRQALLSNTQTLTEAIKSNDISLKQIEERTEGMIREQVARANQIIETVARLNREINTHYVQGKNNPNTLLDERDALVRELSGLIDVDVIDRGAGQYIVNTSGGHTLVDGAVGFELSYEGARAFQNKTASTTFRGSIEFDGTDGYEYTVEFINGGTLGSSPPPLFRVSLDGGKSWVTDAQGNEMHFEANDQNRPVRVKDLDIYFNYADPSAPGSPPADSFIPGDRFLIVPKNALYWIQPTIGPLLITPQEFPDGNVSSHRANGGSIAGNILFMDYRVAEIRDELDEFSKNLIWEVNRVHSQGAGLTHLNSVIGDYRVRNSAYALNSSYIGMPWAERLQDGNFSIALYDPVSGDPIMIDPGMRSALDINFDASWSLDRLVFEMNNITVNWVDGAGNLQSNNLGYFMNISVADNRLNLQSNNGYTFGFGNDTSGVLAALGINTYFKGDGAGNIAMNHYVAQNPNLVNAGRINGGAELNNGDNLTARDIGNLAVKNLTFKDWTGRERVQNLPDYYALLVSKVGSQAAGANFNNKSYMAVAQQLLEQQEEISGVNLDEEMSNLIRFQSSYKAAAKLITTADEMFQTLLGLKQ
ncbi:MAG: flagellar hook-associated protein FlgK [Deltaproteobacteria bacterium]|jgi:flagellar hook-associated protein 1 FlgK|nr:flagellar hook-associated protein FlgK [Deltaproteobacteria bacterium]